MDRDPGIEECIEEGRSFGVPCDTRRFTGDVVPLSDTLLVTETMLLLEFVRALLRL